MKTKTDEGIVFRIATVNNENHANVFAECYTLEDLYDALKAWFQYMSSFGCYDGLKGLFIYFQRVAGKHGAATD